MCIGKLFHYSDLVMSSGASTVAVGCPATPVCQAPGCRRSQQVFRLICPVGQFVCVCLCVCARAKCRSSEKWTLNSYKGPTSIPNSRQYSPWVQFIPPTPTSNDIPFFPTEKIHLLFSAGMSGSWVWGAAHAIQVISKHVEHVHQLITWETEPCARLYLGLVNIC
jgi:hypothetical protein